MRTLRVGARGSDLSLAQTRWLLDRLAIAVPGLEAQVIIIQTHGDRDQDSALDRLWPPGGFVREIERALLEGEIDLAVHSLKDVPTEPVAGLEIAAIPERAAAHDVLLTRAPFGSPAELPVGAVVGSSSPRRAHQVRHIAPQVLTDPIRGNVPTRLAKLAEGQYDAILLAAAGLERLGIQHPHRIEVSPVALPPAPGQGALAAQTRDSGWARDLVAAIDHAPTRAAVTAERAFLRSCGGGCSAAAGAYGRFEHGRLVLSGQMFSGESEVHDEVSVEASEAEALGAALAGRLLEALGRAR